MTPEDHPSLDKRQQPAGQPLDHLDWIDRAVIALAMVCSLVVVSSDGTVPMLLGLVGVIGSVTYFLATAVEALRRELSRDK